MRRRLLLILPFALCAAVGCSLALHFDGYSDKVDCHPDKPPPAPPITPAGKSLPNLTAAFTYMTIEGVDRNGRHEPIGYDLDNACTACPRGTSTCKLAPNATLACSDPTDPKSGRDNALRDVLETVGKAVNAGDGTFNDALKAGIFTGIVSVSNWDGSANASSINVSFYNGLALANGGAATFKNDAWIVESNPISNLPLYPAKEAWVTNGTLVAHFVRTLPDKSPLSLLWPFQNFDAGTGQVPLIKLLLAEAWISGKVSVTSDGKLSMSGGRISGYLAVSDAMQIPLAFGTCPYGPSATTFQQTLGLFCNSADLPDDAGNCNALSLGVGFEAVPATIASGRPAPGNLCPEAGVLPGCAPL